MRVEGEGPRGRFLSLMYTSSTLDMTLFFFFFITLKPGVE